MKCSVHQPSPHPMGTWGKEAGVLRREPPPLVAGPQGLNPGPGPRRGQVSWAWGGENGEWSWEEGDSHKFSLRPTCASLARSHMCLRWVSQFARAHPQERGLGDGHLPAEGAEDTAGGGGAIPSQVADRSTLLLHGGWKLRGESRTWVKVSKTRVISPSHCKVRFRESPAVAQLGKPYRSLPPFLTRGN